MTSADSNGSRHVEGTTMGAECMRAFRMVTCQHGLWCIRFIITLAD